MGHNEVPRDVDYCWSAAAPGHELVVAAAAVPGGDAGGGHLLRRLAARDAEYLHSDRRHRRARRRRDRDRRRDFASGEGRGLLALVGVLSAIAGLILIKKPFETLVVFTLILGVWFVVAGIVRIVSAFASRERQLRTLDRAPEADPDARSVA
jgi:hypothetical protein